MTAQLATRLLVLLSIVYGGVIGILGMLGSSAVTIVAVIGAVVLGGLWAARGLLVTRNGSS